jgi:hypothetical protein
MEKVMRQYVVQFSAAMAVYMVVLVVSLIIIQANPDSLWRVPLAIAPVVPVLFALWAFVRFLRGTDELQRQIHFEAIALAAGATGVLTFTYGFLENVGFPHLNPIWVLPLLIGLWGIGAAIAGRRYS